MIRYKFLLLSFIFFAVSFNCHGADGIDQEKIIVRTAGNHFGLGVLISELDNEEKEELKSKKGALIIEVLDNSEAHKIGLLENDVIVKFNDEVVESAKQLNEMAEDLEEETEVKLTVIRESKEMEFTARIKPLKDGFSFFFKNEGDNFFIEEDGENSFAWVGKPGLKNIHISSTIGDSKGGYLGVIAENISKQMLDYFEVDYGVLIEEIIDDSPAEKAGIKAGDVITHIEGRKIKDYSDLTRTVNYYNPGEKVQIEYVRKGSKENVEVELGEKESTGKVFPQQFDVRVPKVDVVKPDFENFEGKWFKKSKDKEFIIYLI